MAAVGCEKKYDTVVGSWYNSGFHGHYRSLPRNYYNTFREISKPEPPRKFSARIQEGTFAHPFTKHDNKKTFTNDVDQLAQYGLRKDPDRSKGRFNGRFITWDKKHDPKRYMSCYRTDSRSSPLNLHIKDCMKDWEPLGNRMEFNTMYREHFCRRATVTHELRARSSEGRANTTGQIMNYSSSENSQTRRKKQRPYTTNLATGKRGRIMELRPEWMGSSILKQRNQSDFSLANEYHGYSWEGSRRSSSAGSRANSNEIRDQGTNTEHME